MVDLLNTLLQAQGDNTLKVEKQLFECQAEPVEASNKKLFNNLNELNINPSTSSG